MEDLLQELEYSENTLKKKIINQFGDDVIITCLRGKKIIICSRDTGFKILSIACYMHKSQNPEDELLRIGKTTAAIIRDDIRRFRCHSLSKPANSTLISESLLD